MTAPAAPDSGRQGSNALPKLVVIQVAISVVAVAIMIALVLQIGPLIEKRTELEAAITKQTEFIRELEEQEELLKQEVDQLVEQLTKLETIQTIKPRARSEFLPGKETSSGRPFYKFILWLELPPNLEGKIERVRYKLDHPTFVSDTGTSTNEADGFATSYEGWACIAYVKITVFLKDGTVQPIHFSMCRSMMPGSDAPHGG